MSYLLLIPISFFVFYLVSIFSFVAYTDDMNFISDMKFVSRLLLNFVLCFYLVVAAVYSTKFLIKEINAYKQNRIRVEQLIKKGLALESLQEMIAIMEEEQRIYNELRQKQLEEKFKSDRREA